MEATQTGDQISTSGGSNSSQLLPIPITIHFHFREHLLNFKSNSLQIYIGNISCLFIVLILMPPANIHHSSHLLFGQHLLNFKFNKLYDCIEGDHFCLFTALILSSLKRLSSELIKIFHIYTDTQKSKKKSFYLAFNR